MFPPQLGCVNTCAGEVLSTGIKLIYNNKEMATRTRDLNYRSLLEH